MMFSVIIPTYNRADLLPATLESVLRDTEQEIEVIVSDDGSTDDTLNALRPYRDRVVIVEGQNTGPGPCRNRAIEIAHGDYVAFLDSDDLWFPWTLDTYRRAIEENGYPSWLAGSARIFSNSTQLTNVEALPLDGARYASFLAYAVSVRSRWCLGVSGVVIARDALTRSGLFPNRRGNAEDTDLWLRLGVAEGFVRIHDPPCFAERKHGCNVSDDLDRVLEGVHDLIEAETLGRYPGGSKYQRGRLEVLTLPVRNACVACLKRGRIRQAWALYFRCRHWHFAMRRFRFLLLFPVLAAWAWTRSVISGTDQSGTT